ncbi:MAG: 4Fe-4S binding protein, partial [bacterium]
PNIAEKFTSSIDMYMQNSNVHNKKEYLEKGNWKKRAGGNSIETINSIEIYDQKNSLEIFMGDSNENFFEWLKVLGDYKTDIQMNNVHISIADNNILNIKYDKNSTKEKITTNSSNIIDLSHLKKIAYKTNYCVHCGSCEAECPTGALNVFPKVNIDTILCIHCSKCLDFHNKGCVMADSAHKTVVGEGKGNNDIKGFNDYGDFGLRQEWLTSFLNNGFSWVIENELGTKQKISIKKWFRDAELLDSKVRMVTPFFILLQKNILSDNQKYQLILINLYHNSSLLKWYIDNIPVNNSLNTNELSILAKEYTFLAETTIKHSINSLVNLFDTTPLGEELKIGFITKEKNVRYIEKIGTDNVSNEAILYSLYKLKEINSRDNFRVSEFYDENFEGGPYKIFGINKDKLIQKLRFISEDTKLIDVDLNQGLDNIFLKDLSAMDVLEEILK